MKEIQSYNEKAYKPHRDIYIFLNLLMCEELSVKVCQDFIFEKVKMIN